MAISSNGRIVKTTKKAKTERGPISPPRGKCCSGTKQEEDQDGEVKTPPEHKPEKRRLQGIVIDGITYTCAACRAGHRVGVCKHAKERPMRATHPPGRPASGATKKIVCDCPKNCSCARKGCRCPRNCSCTQEMYLLVYVPAAQEPEECQEDEDTEENGSWKLGKQVTTDLKGNLLSEEEVEKRQQQKLAQKAEKESVKTFPVAPVVSEGQLLMEPSISKQEPKHCCKASQPPEPIPSELPTPLQSMTVSARPASTQGCFCGVSCSCAFCPQHPNNPTSQNLARQQALLFSQQQPQPNPSSFMHMQQNVDSPHISSCVGQQPMFAMSSLSSKPTPASFQRAFPLAAPGYMLAYPMRGHFGRQAPPTPVGPPVAFNMNVAQPTPALHDTNVLDSSLNFDDMFFDIGDALVASDGPDGWHQLSSDQDPFLSFPEIAPPNTFDSNTWDNNVGVTASTLDLSSTPILPQIEPNFLDPTQDMAHESVSSTAYSMSHGQHSRSAATMRSSSDMSDPQLYVSPGIYLSPSGQGGILPGVVNDSWRLQAL